MIGKRNLPSYLAKYDSKLRLIQCSCVYRSRIHERTIRWGFWARRKILKTFYHNYVQEFGLSMCFRMFLRKFRLEPRGLSSPRCLSIDRYAVYLKKMTICLAALLICKNSGHLSRKKGGGCDEFLRCTLTSVERFSFLFARCKLANVLHASCSTCIKNVWRPENRSDRCK